MHLSITPSMPSTASPLRAGAHPIRRLAESAIGHTGLQPPLPIKKARKRGPWKRKANQGDKFDIDPYTFHDEWQLGEQPVELNPSKKKTKKPQSASTARHCCTDDERAPQEASVPHRRDEIFCKVCNSPESTRVNYILLCDKCNAGYHQLCMRPPLRTVPSGHWFCTYRFTDF